MKVALSGVTSFTGVWISQALQEAGCETHGLCSGAKPEDYTGLKRIRHDEAARSSKLHYSIRSENGSMAAWIKANAPEVWVHHHHHMDDFRSPNYDARKAHAVGIEPLAEIVRALKSAGTKLLIFSGSYFEPGEGARDPSYRPTPYAQSKHDTWVELQKLSAREKINLKKIVISNPIGPLENEDRLIPTLLRASVQGRAFDLSAPDSVADNLSVFEVAKVYAEVVKGSSGDIFRPSMGGQTNADLTARVNEALVQQRLQMQPCAINLTQPPRPRSEFLNPENEIRPQNWDALWDGYARYARAYIS